MFQAVKQWLMPDRVSPRASDPIATQGRSLVLDDLLQMRLQAEKLARRGARQVHTRQAGGDRSHSLGRGLDFAEVREYLPGDDVRMIDWKVTARSGTPHTKLYHEERERPVYFVLDYRPSMYFATRVAYKSIIASHLAALLAWATVRHNDRIGGFVVSPAGIRELRPTQGVKGVMHLLQAMVSLHDDGDTEALGKHTLTTVMARLSRAAHPGSQVYLLSDFYDIEYRVDAHLNWLLKHCEMTAIQLLDPLECRLPTQGTYSFSNGTERSRLDLSNDELQDLFTQRYEQRRQALQYHFSARNNHYAQALVTDDLIPLARSIMHRQLESA